MGNVMITCVLCVMLKKRLVNISCTEYGNSDDTLVLNDIFTQDTEIQFKIAENAKIRIIKRTMKLEAGLDSTSPGSQAPTFF